MAGDHFSKFQAIGKTTVLNTNRTILMGYDSENRNTTYHQFQENEEEITGEHFT